MTRFIETYEEVTGICCAFCGLPAAVSTEWRELSRGGRELVGFRMDRYATQRCGCPTPTEHEVRRQLLGM